MSIVCRVQHQHWIGLCPLMIDAERLRLPGTQAVQGVNRNSSSNKDLHKSNKDAWDQRNLNSLCH
ncbi:predicted protein [Botrytis cinerea T4]|uniref:Uncharacterized protein n=1 Tax=Botryotinia fuckeliana (strain T4) TaxID=999810 RepID=G2Y862_BOTF4|nr:predicted protein [Botrytis cinerea T4]